MSNSFELTAEQIVDIYRKRWAIETLFKQLKQNFPLKYFLGDNQNAIEIQIWMTIIANLLFTVLKKTSKTKLSFSNLVVLVRIVLMDYISIYKYLKDPEKEWRLIIENREKIEEKNLFSQ